MCGCFVKYVQVCVLLAIALATHRRGTELSVCEVPDWRHRSHGKATHEDLSLILQNPYLKVEHTSTCLKSQLYGSDNRWAPGAFGPTSLGYSKPIGDPVSTDQGRRHLRHNILICPLAKTHMRTHAHTPRTTSLFLYQEINPYVPCFPFDFSAVLASYTSTSRLAIPQGQGHPV